jgi:hypothetical protein
MSKNRRQRRAEMRINLEEHALAYQDPVARTHWQLDQIAHQLNWVNFQLKAILDQDWVDHLPWEVVQAAVGPAMGRSKTIRNRLRQVWLRTQSVVSSSEATVSSIREW